VHVAAIRESVTSDTIKLTSIHIRFLWNELLYRWAATFKGFEGLFCLHLQVQTVQEAIALGRLDSEADSLTFLRKEQNRSPSYTASRPVTHV